MKYYFYLFSVLAALLPVGCNQIPEEPAGPDVPGIQSAQDFIGSPGKPCVSSIDFL